MFSYTAKASHKYYVYLNNQVIASLDLVTKKSLSIRNIPSLELQHSDIYVYVFLDLIERKPFRIRGSLRVLTLQINCKSV